MGLLTNLLLCLVTLVACMGEGKGHFDICPKDVLYPLKQPTGKVREYSVLFSHFQRPVQPDYEYVYFVLVCQVCHNKIPQTECLEKQKYICTQFCKLEVQDQGLDTFGFFHGLTPWLVSGHLLIVFLFFSLHTHFWCLVLCVSKFPLRIRTPVKLD